jgi:predicted transposase/invertase (TIGR01784 family)
MRVRMACLTPLANRRMLPPMAPRYLDPKNDVVFKRIFGEHPHILRSMLNALLPLAPHEQIASLEYLSPEQAPQLPLLKNSIVDVRCRDRQGRQFIVEMQMSWTSAFLQRVLFNASKAYVQQLERGEQYEHLQPVIGLSVLDDVFDRSSDAFYHHYQIVNVERPERIIEGLQLVFIELPKFRAEPTKATLQQAWLRFLKETGAPDSQVRVEQLRAEVAGAAPELQEALDLTGEAAFSRAELEAYDRYWDVIRSERTLLSGKYAEGRQLGINEGRQLGIDEGRQLGIDEGRQLGIDEGRQRERQRLVEKLIASGMSQAQAQALLDS